MCYFFIAGLGSSYVEVESFCRKRLIEKKVTESAKLKLKQNEGEVCIANKRRDTHLECLPEEKTF